ncbi:pseudouridine synthase [Brevundimonas sp. GW460-12-10-14-LB2]|jgi:23S rRNA pseudouridine2605 synthase|uniref:pseudouridine synthase n=1 Tax=Brevundimonas sp. GW460-12-10-14-LB2 TaxID=1827469 RepID=UPI0007BCA4F2|nr:pseudouridine synthase [Brevundimonas sp. GW460-12-10-14-LB2]ANC55126.1 pseudouridine synthase [Brevundimonas sp. GW460-12-10-14-LB2]
MVRHTDDNDKKPRARQDERSPRPFKSSGPRKSGDGTRSFGDKPRGPREDGAMRFGDKADRPRSDKPRSDRPRTDKPRSDGGGKDGKSKTPDTPLRAERIAKTMARAGIASRREVERLIGLGKVAVNGRILDTPATLVTRDDVITVDGKPIGSTQATRVWRYHKPAGLLTSHSDPTGRPTVFDALPAGLPRVISVGRLDLATEGLLLLTNDGELSRALELPSTSLVRQYRARARGKITQEQLDALKDGVVVDGVSYGPIEAKLDKAKESKSEDGKAPANLWISVSITEGKNREVRKVLESVGLTVNRLIRLAYGPFRLDVLPIGSVEEVGPRVIRELLADYIRPENLPTGNTVETPAPIPGRRVSTPIVKGRSGSAMSDPSRKPSRVRAAETAQADAVERRERPPKKEGWAKAAPKFEHSKSFKPRERTAPAGDRPAREDGDRPKRAFKPRDDQFIDDRRGKPGAKPAGRAGSGPRAGGPGGKPAGGRDFKPRTGGGKPAGPSGTSGRGPGGKPRTPR